MENHDVFVNYSVLAGILVGASVLVLMYILKLFHADVKNVEQTKYEKIEQSEKRKEPSQKTKKKTADNRWIARTDKQGFSHPWLLTTLKAHSGQVLDMDFSANGKYLASCAEDRTIHLWDVKDLSQKEHKSLRINVDFDYATFIKWSPDTKAFLIQRYQANSIEIYKVERKKDGMLGHATKALTFPKASDDDVIGIGIASTGKFIMTCSNKTDLTVWDLKGQRLGQVDTYLMNTACAKISPCGRFIVACGFAPDAKVWEVKFTKQGEFSEIKRVFELTGHSSGIHDVAFDVDTSHMATVAKDGTWRLYNTNVEYAKGEDPKLLVTGRYEQAAHPASVALSPNAAVVVVASGGSLAFYVTASGELDYTIEGAYYGTKAVIMFDSSGNYLLSAGDRHIRVFHNVTGYKCAIADAKEKLKQSQTSATKERLMSIIKDSQTFLANVTSK